MTTQAEIDMQARLADMERQIAELAAKVNPLYSGGMDRYIHSGYLQFDGIPMRWDPTGRQIVVGSSTSDRYFYEFLVSQLTTNPGSKYPLLATGGYVSSTEIQQDVSAYLTSGNYGRVFVFADNTPSQRGGAEAARGATVAQVFANIGETDDGHVKVKPAILFERVASRPTGLAEGGLWAGTDDKLYFYDGASDIDITGGGMSLIVKEADETVNNNNTAQNDNELLFAVAANEVWQFEGVLFVTSGTTPDFTMTFSGPTGAVGAWGAILNANSGGSPGTTGAPIAGGGQLGTADSLETTGTIETIRFWGAIHNGANAGNLTLQWAQNTATATDTKVLAGSYIKYQIET